MTKAYYNEHDPQNAAWLRELMKAGIIAPGDVDERSIEDVIPNELIGYTQCHFFAGIGVWSYALRCAGWPDDRPVWTGSCPCQPFSAAGKRGGTSDERHLWPAFFHLVSQCRPDVVFGEQVASPDGLDWLDVVHADLEAAGYPVGALDLCAAGLGAPHIRQRLYFVADAGIAASKRDARKILGAQARIGGEDGAQYGHCVVGSGNGGADGGVANAELSERGPINRARGGFQRQDGLSQGEEGAGRLAGNGAACGMDYANGERRAEYAQLREGQSNHFETAGTGATNGFWRDAEWIYCRDGKYRAVESVPESMADGIAGDLGLVRLQSYPDRENAERTIYAPLISKGKKRVMRLKGYGNAICAPVAEAFIRSYLDDLCLQTSL